MKLPPSVRNILIIVVLAAIVAFVSAGRTAANVVLEAASLGFLAAFAWIGMRLYREHRLTLYALGTRRRTIIYVAGGVATLALSATHRMWSTSFGSILWIVLMAGAGYSLYAVYRSAKEY